MIIVTITGPSASGKTTLLHKLMQEGEYEEVPGYSTRPPRENDAGESNYVFVSEEDFAENKDDFCEIIEIYGNTYGRKWDDILKIVSRGKVPVVIITYEGIEVYKKVAKFLNLELVTVWVGGDIQTLTERQAKRVESRIDNLEDEMKRYKLHSWDIVVKSFNESTENKVIQNLMKYIPAAVKQKSGRFWT